MRSQTWGTCTDLSAVAPTSLRSEEHGDPIGALSLSVVRSRNIHDLADHLRPYDVRFLHSGPMNGMSEIVQAHWNEIVLASWRFEQPLIQQGKLPSGRITFGLRDVRQCLVKWHGTALDFDDLTVSGSQTEVDIVSAPGFSTLAVSFPERMVQTAAERLGLSLRFHHKCRLVFPIGEVFGVRARTIWKVLLNYAVEYPWRPSELKWFAEQCAELLKCLLLGCARSTPSDLPCENRNRFRIVKQALAAIDEEPGEPLRIADLCRLTHASERALHYAFTEYLNVSPARYLKLHRLQGAHRDFRRTDRIGVKTADIANDWGFWHLGQFAKDYRDLFGELPSDTHWRTREAACFRSTRLPPNRASATTVMA